MSAVDFGARALAKLAGAQAPLTYSDLAQASLPETVSRIDSTGYFVRGRGAGTYVCDELATAGLAAAHPWACFKGDAGRYFRLLGTAEGWITPEQLGCPAYREGVDQRAYIQAGIDYAIAVGLSGVMLTQRVYELWATRRTGGFTEDADHSGCYLVILGQCSLDSTHPLRSTLHCKGPKGGSAETDYQVMNGTHYGDGMIWRGHGIKIAAIERGSPFGAPKPVTRKSMSRIWNLILLADTVGERDTDWPATIANPNCWDTSHKGIYFQQDVQHGITDVRNVDIVGFLGECIYMGYMVGGVTGGNIRCRDSNGQALNPSGPEVLDLDGVEAFNCGFTVEGWSGPNMGRIRNFRARNCGKGNYGGGFGYGPVRRADGTIPLGEFHGTLEQCGDWEPCSYSIHHLNLVDTPIALIQKGSSGLMHDCIVHANSHWDKRNNDAAIRFAGHANDGARMCSNIKAHVHISRSKAAQAANRAPKLFTYSGSIGPEVVLHASGPINGIGGVSGTPNDFRPKIVDEGLELLSLGAAVWWDASAGNPEPGNYFLRPTGLTGGATRYSVSLPSTANYNDGHACIIQHRDSSGSAGLLEIEGKVLLKYRQRAKFVCDRAQAVWHLVERPEAITFSAPVDIPSAALGAEAGPFTIAAKGCRPKDHVIVTPASATGGFAVIAARAENDQVKFWVRNLSGSNPEDPAQQMFTAHVRAGV